MAGMARVVLPQMSHHLVQRGHNRKVVFVEAGQYERYLEDLRGLSETLEVRGYAYCLMTKHLHLLLGSADEGAAMGRLMKALGPGPGGIAMDWKPIRHVVGATLQVQPGAGRNVPARLCALHPAQPCPGKGGDKFHRPVTTPGPASVSEWAKKNNGSIWSRRTWAWRTAKQTGARDTPGLWSGACRNRS